MLRVEKIPARRRCLSRKLKRSKSFPDSDREVYMGKGVNIRDLHSNEFRLRKDKLNKSIWN